MCDVDDDISYCIDIKTVKEYMIQYGLKRMAKELSVSVTQLVYVEEDIKLLNEVLAILMLL